MGQGSRFGGDQQSLDDDWRNVALMRLHPAGVALPVMIVPSRALGESLTWSGDPAGTLPAVGDTSHHGVGLRWDKAW